MLPFGDHSTMIQCVVEGLRPVCGRVQTIVKPGQQDQCPATVETLIEPDGLPQHPLSGIVAGLNALGPDDWAVFVPCDTPCLGSNDIERLVEVAQMGEGSVASDGSQRHPLLCCVPGRAAHKALDCMLNGRSARRFVEGLDAVVMSERALQNFNTPADLANRL